MLSAQKIFVHRTDGMQRLYMKVGGLHRYGKDSEWLPARRSGVRIPVGGEIFCTHPDRPRDAPNLLYNEYRFFLLGVKRPECETEHRPLSSAGIEYELYVPTVAVWQVTGETLSVDIARIMF